MHASLNYLSISSKIYQTKYLRILVECMYCFIYQFLNPAPRISLIQNVVRSVFFNYSFKEARIEILILMHTVLVSSRNYK